MYAALVRQVAVFVRQVAVSVRQGTPRAEQNSLPGRGLALQGAPFSFENTLQLKLYFRKWDPVLKPLVPGACCAQWRGLKILERAPKFLDRGVKF